MDANRLDIAFNAIFKNKLLFSKIIKLVTDKELNYDGTVEFGLVYKRKFVLKATWEDVCESTKLLISYGHIDQLKQLITKLEINNTKINIFHAYIKPYLAFTTLHLPILKFIQQTYFISNTYNDSDTNNIAWPPDLLVKATKFNNLQVVNYIFEFNNNGDGYGGDKQFKFILSEDVVLSSFLVAIKLGHVNIVRYLVDKMELEFNVDQMFESLINLVSRAGGLEMLKFFFEEMKLNFLNKHFSSLIHNAAVNGRMDIVEYLIPLLPTGEPNQIAKLTNRTFHATSKFGRLDILKQLIEYIRLNQKMVVNIGFIIDTAAAHGQLDFIQYLENIGMNIFQSCSPNAMNLAAERGHLSVVKYLHCKRKEGCTVSAINNAAMNGHMEIIQFLFENRTERYTVLAITRAAGFGNLDIVKFLVSNYTGHINYQAPILNACRHGHLDIVKYFHALSNGNYHAHRPFCEATKGGHFEVVRFLFEQNRASLDNIFLGIAIYTPNVQILDYLFVDMGVPIRLVYPIYVDMMYAGYSSSLLFILSLVTNAMDAISPLAVHAARKGDIAVIDHLLNKYDIINFFQLLDKILLKALGKLNFRLIEHVIEHFNSREDINESSIALDLELFLEWAASSSSPENTKFEYFDRFISKFVNKSKFRLKLQEAHIRYLSPDFPFIHVLTKYNNMIEFSVPIFMAMNKISVKNIAYGPVKIKNHPSYDIVKAVRDGDMKFIKLYFGIMEENKTLLKDESLRCIMDEAAQFGRYEALLFLHATKLAGCTAQAMDNASKSNHLDIVKWLHQNRKEGCTEKALNCAVWSNNIKMVTFLLENRTALHERNMEAAISVAITHDFPDMVELLYKNLFTPAKIAYKSLNIKETLKYMQLYNSLKTQVEEYRLKKKNIKNKHIV